MRNNGKAYTKNATQKQVQAATETQDAVLWDILSPTQCRVMIQGSNSLVVCSYPQNTNSQPAWMKIGSAVRILHVGGSRGNTEIIGSGHAVPKNAASTTPPPTTPVDAVLNGCKVLQIPTGPQMAVMVMAGQLRVDGQVLNLPLISMASGSAYNMSMGGYMGTVAAVFDVPIVPQGEFRQDIVVVNSSGVVEYIQGALFNGSEIMPTVPSDCLLLNNIFVVGGSTSILQSDMGAHYQPPFLASLTATFESISGAHYGTWPLGAGYQVDIAYFDQYGNPFAATWVESLTVISGTATVQQISACRWFLGATSNTQFAALSYSVVGTNINTRLAITIPQ